MRFKWGVVIAVALIAIMLAGCSGTKDSGTNASVNGVTFTVSKVSETDNYNGQRTDNKYVVVSLHAANDGKKEQRFSSENFYLEDSDKREYKGSTTRDLGQAGGAYFDYAKPIVPGTAHDGNVAFEVPKDAADFTVVISEDFSKKSGEKRIKIN